MWKLVAPTSPPIEIPSKNRYLTDSAYRSGTMSENAGRNLSDDFFRKFLLTFQDFSFPRNSAKIFFKKCTGERFPNRFLMSSESCIQNLSDQLFFSDLHFRKIRISAEIHFRGNGMWHKKMCTGEMFEIDFL